MTGLVKRTGHSVRTIRTGIEMVVVAAGWLLGGTLGLGTLLYALTIGPIVHRMLPLFTIPETQSTPAASPPEEIETPGLRKAA